MILVDVNILVYAWDAGSPSHETARVALRHWVSGGVDTGVFARGHESRIYAHPAAITRAWQQVTDWLSCGNVWIPHARGEHDLVLGELLRNPGGGAKLIPDAHLAALAIEHGLVLCSTDGDFARFAGLRWMNPLQG